MNERQYKDVAGNPCTLRWLVKNEPEWAENQIRHRDTLERELAGADQVIAALMARLDRANARIARLEEAGDSLKEEARPTMFDCDETRKRIMDTIDAWDAAREAKP